MDAILTDSHLDPMITGCILTDVTVPKQDKYGTSTGRECETRKTDGNSTDNSSQRNIKMFKND